MKVSIIKTMRNSYKDTKASLLTLFFRWRGISSAVRYLRNPNPAGSVQLLRAFGASVGEGTTIKRSLMLDNTYEDEDSAGDFSHLRIGKNCYIGDCVFLDLADEIVIEDNVVISGGVSILTHADCNRSAFLSSVFPRENARVHILSGAWVGFNATIHHGVTIGENAVISSCSLVKEDVGDYQLFSRTPARRVKSLRE